MVNLYDRVLTSRSLATLISLVLIVIALYIFWSALNWVRSRLLIRLSLHVDWDLAAEVFDATFRRHVTRRNINTHQALNSVQKLRQFMTGPALIAVLDTPFAPLFMVLGGIFHIYLAIFAIVATVVIMLSTYVTQKITTPLLRSANEASAEASRLAAFNLRHAEAAYALGMHGAIRRRWYERHREFVELQANAGESTGLLGGFSGFLGRALMSLQLSLGAYLAIEGYITGGMVIAASLLIHKAISPINRLLANWSDIVAARQAYEYLNTLLLEDEAAGLQMKLPAPAGRLVVTDAAAVAPGATSVAITGLNFTVEPGRTVAVVGPSASGKSCLARLLTGVWKPARGSVRLDGVEIFDWNHDELGPWIGYVPQEIDFFEGTIAENIARLGAVNPDKVVAAARLIGIHETILALPKGYDTVLGESGHTLSAGQRQRVAIARAFYGMPKFVVMDEPNSNLDEVGEQALLKTIATAKQHGCTVILTTQRPRPVGVVDDLLVLRDGAQLRYGPAKVMLEEVRKLRPAGTAEARSQPGEKKAVAAPQLT